MDSLKFLIGSFLILVLLSPVLILVLSGILPADTFAPGTIEVLEFTTLQAALSAALAIALGLAGAYGIGAAEIKWGRANARFLEAISLLPNVAPVLLFLLAVMKFAPGLRDLTGIIIVHAMLNAGLVSASVLRLFRSKVAGLADLAYIEGASRLKFFASVVLPVIASDLRMIFAFVFAICFSSLSVPLVIGGSRATTLEVLIWQSIRIEGNLARAFGISILQLASILLLTLLLRKRTTTTAVDTVRSGQPLLSNFAGLPFVLVPSLLLIVSLLDRPWIGVARILENQILLSELSRTVLGSLSVAVGTGALTATLLLLIAYVEPRGTWRKLLLGYVAPSTVVTGFAMLLAWRATGTATYFKIIFAITLVSVPSLYRLYWDAILSSLRNQREVAMSLGAEPFLIFRRIVLPQAIKPACFVAGLSSLWAWGDFALSRTIAERDVTLGMLVQSLTSTYRFEIATSLVWIMLIGGAFTFFSFQYFVPKIYLGASRVFDQKS